MCISKAITNLCLWHWQWLLPQVSKVIMQKIVWVNNMVYGLSFEIKVGAKLLGKAGWHITLLVYIETWYPYHWKHRGPDMLSSLLSSPDNWISLPLFEWENSSPAINRVLLTSWSVSKLRHWNVLTYKFSSLVRTQMLITRSKSAAIW